MIKINEEGNTEKPMNQQEKIDIYKEIMNDYQMTLKNNENHSKKDDFLMGTDANICLFRKIDYSIENVFLFLNFVIAFIMLIFITMFL